MSSFKIALESVSLGTLVDPTVVWRNLSATDGPRILP